MTITTYNTAGVIVSISSAKLDEIRAAFKTVHYHPDGQVPDDHLAEVDMWFTSWTGLPPNVTSLKQIPRTKVIQLSSAGANNWLAREIMQSKEAKEQIKICSASGIHTLSIPQYIIANVVNLFMKLQIQLHLARTEAEWPGRDRVVEQAGLNGKERPENRYLFGKTVGMLTGAMAADKRWGYGHIARETARLFNAFHCNVIAANSKGHQRPEHGYAIPGTGDPDALLPEGAVFISVGRGDVAESKDILAALDAPGGLWGAALDVTDPEPLPKGHPLFTHPAVIITPHTSGSFEAYFDSGADVLLRQKERLCAGEGLMNVVDPEKGY